MGKKIKKNVPELRFPEFDNNWDTDRIDNFLVRHVDSVDVDLETNYKQIGIRSHGKGIFHKEAVTGRELGNKRVYWVHPSAFVVNIVFAWEQAVALTSSDEDGFIASHRFLMFLPKQNRASLKFVILFFLRERGKYLLELASPGGAGRNKTLGQQNFAELEITLPKIAEQEKIASFLGAVDTRLNQLRRKRELLQTYKRGVMQKIFAQKIRFKSAIGSPFPEWEQKKLGQFAPLQRGFDLPVDNIVEGQFPVVFSNGILKRHHEYKVTSPGVVTGRSGTIGKVMYIEENFCPHNTSLWVTDFKGNFPRFVYYFYIWLDLTRFSSGSGVPTLNRNDVHTYSIDFPLIQEQEKIANFLTAIDRKIETLTRQIEQTEQFKKGLLQKLFI